MKVASYVADFISGLTRPGVVDSDVNLLDKSSKRNRTRVYAICGSGAMHLNDAICHHPGIEVIPMQHEQAATYAAEADARVTGDIGVVHVTSGPGGANTVTGLACAYVDSVPLLVIAGQVTSHSMAGPFLRQNGINELNMVAITEPVTKYSVTVLDPKSIRKVLEEAVWHAMHWRRGPVFVEIPLDIQVAEIDPDNLEGYVPVDVYLQCASVAKAAVRLIRMARRPVLLVGNGARNTDIETLADILCIPIVSSWPAADIIPNRNPNYIGRCGLFGDRASNYAVHNSDLILSIGCRMTVGLIGHHPHLFAPDAKKIVVDIDPVEAHKLNPLMSIVADAGNFVDAMVCMADHCGVRDWNDEIYDRKVKPEVRPPYKGGISAYDFIYELNKKLSHDAIVVTDAGFAFVCTMQELRLNGKQRLMYSQGVSPMGWGLPAAIGAAKSSPGRQIVCLAGDGGLMLNIQELHTIAKNRLPIAIFVLANEGYETMRISQNAHFKRESISGDMDSVEIAKIAAGFGIKTLYISDLNELVDWVKSVLVGAENGPYMCVMKMAPNQVITPRVQAKLVGDKFAPVTLMDMN